MVRIGLLLSSLLLVLAGCASAPWKEAAARNSVAGWRAFLLAHPEHPQAGEARERLRTLLYTEATSVHSVVAYKRFLEEFPDAPEAEAVRARLEGLRFVAAEEEGTATGWRQFLRDHPQGAHRAEAEARLAELLQTEARAKGDSASLASLVRAAGEAPSPELVAQLDDARFREADTTAGLLAYLRELPAGRHRDEARVKLLERQVEALLVSGQLEAARREVATHPLAARAPELPRRLARAEAEQALLARGGERLQTARASHYLRSVEDLTQALSAPDALDRWQAAQELGHHVTLAALPPLLEALRTQRSVLVRQEAFASLRRILSSLPPPVAEHAVSTRLEEVRPKAAGSELALEVAALLDASGQLAEAAPEYQRAAEGRAVDPVVLRRWVDIRRERGQHFSSAVAARQLALWARTVASEEVVDEATPLAASRHLCAAVRNARFARDAIEEVAGRVRDFPEDVAAFRSLAAEALALSEARLKDAEYHLKRRTPHARTCDDDRVGARLREGEAARLAALERLRRESAEAASLLLEQARSLDPSPEVRRRAAALLAGGPDTP